MSEPVRILIVGLPRMLREILEEALGDAPGMVVVGEGDGAPVRVLAIDVRRYRAGFVVGDADTLDTGQVAVALHECPGLRVLAVSHDGRTAALHELRPHREPLGEASSERLIAIIREHAIVPVRA